MNVPLLDLKGQYTSLRDEMRAVLDDVCDSQMFILGESVLDFEEHTAAYCGVPHAVGVSSGTDALIAALMAYEIGPGDAVITTPYTFFATAGSIARTGATPVFVDIDPVTFNIDPVAVRELLTDWPARFSNLAPKALMPVHLYGQMADMVSLMKIAKDFDLRVIEDAAQAIGSEMPDGDGGVWRAGMPGDLGCFSFFPSKNLGAFGDGGLVTARDEALDERLRSLRMHGAVSRYEHSIVGGNFRLDALQAAVLDVKLPYLDTWHAQRQENAAFYNKGFEGSSVQPPVVVNGGPGVRHSHIYNQYIIRVPERDRIRDHLREKEIGCEVYYPIPMHMQACFAYLGYAEGDFPESERAAAETLALPIFPELTDEMQGYVVETLCKALT